MRRGLFNQDSSAKSEELSLHRMEALYDGMLAIAMTLLVLDIEIPASFDIRDSVTLMNALSAIHVTFLDYFISFFIIASFWVGNNTEFLFVKKTDRSYLWINLITIFFIALIPFTTSLQDDLSGIVLADILFHINILIVVFLKYLRWKYIYRHENLVNKEIKDISEIPIHIKLAKHAILIPLIGMIMTFVIKDYANLVYILFFFLRSRNKSS